MDMEAGFRTPWLELEGSGVTMGGMAARAHPPAEVCAPPPPPGSPISNVEKIGPHLRLQDTTCSSIDMPPRKSGAPPGAPLKIGP